MSTQFLIYTCLGPSASVHPSSTAGLGGPSHTMDPSPAVSGQGASGSNHTCPCTHRHHVSGCPLQPSDSQDPRPGCCHLHLPVSPCTCTKTYMSVFMTVQHCLDYCTFIVSFEIRKCKSCNFALHFYDCFGHSGSIEFPCAFSDQFNFCKEASWDFDRDCVESVD